MYSILQYQTKRNQKDAVKFLQDLITIPSASLEESAIAERIEKEMNHVRFDRVFRDDVGNVVGLIYGKESDPTVLLNCHMDTTPMEASGAWGRDPYAPQVENQCLYGLGASDCKSGIAAQVYAARVLKDSFLPLRGNLVVALTVAEENGLSLGMKHLIEHTLPELGLEPNYVILGEPTDLGLYYGHDGWAEISIKIESVNPFAVNETVHALCQSLIPTIQEDGSQLPMEEVVISQPVFDEVEGLHRVYMSLDQRLYESDHIDDVIEHIQKDASMISQNFGPVAVNVAVREEQQKVCAHRTHLVRYITHAWSTDPFHPLMDRARQSLSAAGCQVKPGKWKLERLGMGTAGSYLVKEKRLPTIGYGPGNEDQAHVPNEYVKIGNIQEAIYGTAAIVHGLIGVPVFGWTSDEI